MFRKKGDAQINNDLVAGRACPNPEIPEVAARKSSTSKAKILFAAVLAVAMLVVLTFSSGTVKNAALKAVLSPKAYFRLVTKSALKSEAGNAVRLYGSLKTFFAPEKSTTGEIKVSLSDGLSKLLEDAGMGDAEKDISWIKSAEILVDASDSKNRLSNSLNIKLNDRDIATVNTVLDTDSDTLYIGLPEVNPAYLEQRVSPEAAGIFNSADSLSEILAVLPKEKQVYSIVSDYIDCILGQFNKVSESKDVVFADGISQKATLLTVDIDEALLSKTSAAVLLEMKKDERLKEIILEVGGTEAAGDRDIYADVMAKIDEAIIKCKDEETFKGKGATLNIWVGSKGELIGVSVKAKDAAVISLVTAKKIGKVGVCFDVKKGGESFKIYGSGKVLDSIVTGEFFAKYNEMTLLTVSLEDFDAANLKRGVLKGKALISPSGNLKAVLDLSEEEASLLDRLKLTVKSKKASLKKTECSLELKYGEKSCGILAIDTKAGKKENVQIANAVNAGDSEQKKLWISTAFAGEVMENLKKAGISRTLEEKIKVFCEK